MSSDIPRKTNLIHNWQSSPIYLKRKQYLEYNNIRLAMQVIYILFINSTIWANSSVTLYHLVIFFTSDLYITMNKSILVTTP